MSRTETPSQRLASLLLGQPVHGWIAERRTAGATWRSIAEQLATATNGQVTVSHEAIRLWAEEVAA